MDYLIIGTLLVIIILLRFYNKQQIEQKNQEIEELRVNSHNHMLKMEQENRQKIKEIEKRNQ